VKLRYDITFEDKPTLENVNFDHLNSRRLEFAYIFERGLVFRCHKLISNFALHFNLRLFKQEGPDSPFNLLRKDITRFLTTILIGSTCSGIGSAALVGRCRLTLSNPL